MNWLGEYFTQRASPLTISLWANPPLVLGPDGPAAQPTYALRNPGVQLVFTAAEAVEHGDRRFEIPAHYDALKPLSTSTFGHLPDEESCGFFKSISIYAPSRFNPHFLVTINEAFSFVPVFASDGSPGFLGVCADTSDDTRLPSQMKLPWTFQGYISI